MAKGQYMTSLRATWGGGSWVPVTGQTMVTHGIRHYPTVAAVRLLDACAQLKGDIHMDCSVGQEAKALCRDNQKPGPVVWCGGGKKAYTIKLVGTSQQIVNTVHRG